MSRGKKITTSTVAALALIVAGLAVWYFWLRTPDFRMPDKAYYSDDDGQTYFVDDLWRIVPFDHNGKMAVRAYVYSYDGGKKRFVAYLTKFDDEEKTELEQQLAATRQSGEPSGVTVDVSSRDTILAHTLIKRPGPGHHWSGVNSEEAIQAKQTPSPDGSPTELVFPE